MPQDAQGREPGSPGYQKPKKSKKGMLAKLRERAMSSRRKPAPAAAPVLSKATGKETGSNFKTGAANAQTRRELMGDTAKRY